MLLTFFVVLGLVVPNVAVGDVLEIPVAAENDDVEERDDHDDQADGEYIETFGGEVGDGDITHDVFLTLNTLGRQFINPGNYQRREESKRKYNNHETDTPIRYPECGKQRADHLGR